MSTFIEFPPDFNKQIFDNVKMFLELEPFKIIITHIKIILFVLLIPIVFAVFIKVRKIWKNRDKY